MATDTFFKPASHQPDNMTTPKPIIWHTPFCRSLRPMWTLAELGVDFNIEAYR